MKRYLLIVLVVVVVGIAGTWFWAGRNYQNNMTPLITAAISRSPVKISYESLETSPFTFTTEFKNLKITYTIPEGSDFAKSLPEITEKLFKGKSQFFKDISARSTFELQIPGISCIHYNPITNSIKINSPSKTTFTIKNPNSTVTLYVPEESKHTMSIGLANRQFLFAPIVLEQDPEFGPIPALLGLIRSFSNDAHNYKVIEESSGKPFFTIDNQSVSVNIKNDDANKIISVEMDRKNFQFHKIDNITFIHDLALLAPQIFSEDPGKMDLDFTLEIPKSVLDFAKSPGQASMPHFKFDLKKLKTSDQYMNSDSTFNIGFDTKFFSAKGETTLVVHADKSALIDRTIKVLEENSKDLEESTKQNIDTIKGYVTPLIPDLKAVSPITMSFDVKVPAVTPTLQSIVDGHVNIEFDTKECGIDISGKATQESLQGQITLKNSEILLNGISDIVSRVTAVINPTQKPMVDLMAATLKPIILNLGTPNSTGKNLTIKVTFDKKTQDVKIGSKNMSEVMAMIMPTLAPQGALPQPVVQ